MMREKLPVRISSWSLLLCLFAVCSCLVPAAYAQIAVDVYNPMEPSGEDGQKCISDMLNATNYHSAAVPCVWGINGNAYISTSNGMPLPGPVKVGEATYADGGKRSIQMNNNDWKGNVLYADLMGKPFSVGLSKLTIACYLTQTETASTWYRFDSICNCGGLWIALQSTNEGMADKLYFDCHGQADSGKSTFSPTIEVRPGKTYWVNLKFDGPAGKGYLAVFDPANHFAQVGQTVECGERIGGAISNRIGFGRVDAINEGTRTGAIFFDQVMFDLKGTFPILPKASPSN